LLDRLERPVKMTGKPGKLGHFVILSGRS
jgi:hypothetical protein